MGLGEAAAAGRTILTPNAELAAALFDAVERAHRDAGRVVWETPQIRDFGGWLKEAYLKSQFRDSSTPRCLSDAEERELWRRAVLEGAAGGPLFDLTGAARAARRARRAMIEYAIPERAIGAYGTEESIAFLDWLGRFTALCRAHRCISADGLLDLAGGPRAQAAGLAWIESPSWRPVARRWLERHAGAPLTAQVAARSMPARALKAPSPQSELAAAAEWAAAHLRADPRFRAWICVPDLSVRRDEVTDAFDAALAPQRFALHGAQPEAPAYALAGGSALADYPSVRAALAFLALNAGQVSFERFSALMRSPEWHAAASEASRAAQLDVALRSRAPSEARLEDWLALSLSLASERALGPLTALERLQSAARELHAVGPQPMSRWVALWLKAFEAGPWNLRHRWSSSEYQAAERFRELLGTLATGDRLFEPQTFEGAEGILRRCARETMFQIRTGVPPIWVSGARQDPYLAYGGLWVAACDEGRWPPPPDPIALIPVELQRRYGVLAAAEHSQLEFARDMQQRWEARAVERVFSCADAGEGREAAASPLLAPLGVNVLESAPRPHWSAQLAAAPAFLTSLDETAPSFDVQTEKTRGVLTLRAQSRCAFRGFAETRLATTVLERPVPGFNDRERGELLHDTLRLVWSQLRSSAGLIEQDAPSRARLLSDSARDALARLSRRRDPGPRWCERERVRIIALLAQWLKLEEQRQPFEVEKIEGRSAPFAADSEQGRDEIARFGGLEFKVRIDRMDRLDDGGRVLIDYKSGAAAPDWRGERPDNPQLPLYALISPESLVAVAYGRVNAAECCFVAEAERDGLFRPGGKRTRMEGAASFAELLERWSRRLERLAADFARGYAAVDPTPQACRSCTLHGLCRVPSILAESPDE